MKKTFSMEFKLISKLIKKNIAQADTVISNPDITSAKGFAIGFINRKNEEGFDVYQKDIETRFNINRSSASELISSMEETGYVKREIDSNDARLKKLVLTEKAYELLEIFEETIESIDKKALSGFSKDEIKKLEEYVERIQDNLDDRKKELV